MNYFLYLLLFIFGLAVGSFLNVVALRYRPGQNLLDTKIIGGRSRCPVCQKKLVWYELIPVLSFFWQKGKCRHCGHKLLLQYPLIEVLSGIVFVAVPWYLFNFQFSIFNFQSITQLTNYQLLIALIWVLIFLLFLLLSIIDFRQSIIPDQINFSLGVLGLVLIAINDYYHKFDDFHGSFLRHYAAVFGLRENIWLNHLFAALLGMALFGIIIFFSKGKAMGGGDFKLVASLGLIFGWPDILLILILAFLLGAFLSAIFLIKKKKKMKDTIPFGPFLVIGATLIFFFGYQIIGGYFKLFGL